MPQWIDESLPCADTTLLYRPIKPESCVVYGEYNLPSGYEFAFVPSDAKVSCNASTKKPAHQYLKIPSTSWGASKTFISISQTISGAATLYNARGNQIDIYGYAAFGLTVILYILMSLLNLLAQIFTREYEHLYLVRSEEMDEAELRDGIFEECVGYLTTVPTVDNGDENSFDGNKSFNAQFENSSPLETTTSILQATVQHQRRAHNPEDSLVPSPLMISPKTLSFLVGWLFPLAGSNSGNGGHSSDIDVAVCISIPACSEFERETKLTDGPVKWPTHFRELPKSTEQEGRENLSLNSTKGKSASQESYSINVQEVSSQEQVKSTVQKVSSQEHVKSTVQKLSSWWSDFDPRYDFDLRYYIDQEKRQFANSWIRNLIIPGSGIGLAMVSLGINAALSHFQVGQSTFAQRAWMMSWLICGVVIGVGATYSATVFIDTPRIMLTHVFNIKSTGKLNWGLWIVSLVTYLLVIGTFFVPAFAGMVLVVQMLREYGTCISV